MLFRRVRSGALPERKVERALAELGGRVFAPEERLPARDRVERLARRHALRGADLWHLALALDVSSREPSLALVTFDAAIAAAARAEGLPLAV